MRHRKSFTLIEFVVVIAVTLTGARADTADELLAKAEIAGGLILHVGCGDGALSSALYQRENTRVYGLGTSAERFSWRGRTRMSREFPAR